MPSVARYVRLPFGTADSPFSSAVSLSAGDVTGRESSRCGKSPTQTTMMVAYSDASLKNGHVGIGCKLYQPLTSSSTGENTTHLSNELLVEDELDRSYTSEMAEYAAVIEAARAASQYDVGMLILASDCRNVVEKIRRREAIVEDGTFRDRLYEYLDEFDNWRVRHVNRQRNTEAHDEARKAIRHAPTV